MSFSIVRLVSSSDAEPAGGRPAAAASSSASARGGQALDFAALYDAWFERVSCWLAALGAPPAEEEDLAQEVFLVVRRRLGAFDGRNVAGWLYQIARRQVLRHKRRRWVRRILALPPGDDLFARIEHPGPSPHAAVEARERRRQLDGMVAELSEKRRVVFVLFEVEGYSGEEIAGILDVPLNTVWTRLHHGRKDFLRVLARSKHKEAGKP